MNDNSQMSHLQTMNDKFYALIMQPVNYKMSSEIMGKKADISEPID